MRWWTAGAMALVLSASGCGWGPDETAPSASTGTGTTGGTGSTAPTTPTGGAPAAPAKVDPKDYKEMEGGLKYAILKEGAGEGAGHNTVKVHYTGWLENGKKFDSSLDRGDPFSFELGHGAVIKGWDLGVKGMKVGEKRQLVIPSDLGYGAQGSGADIPPNSTLIFDVELVEIAAPSH